MRTFYPQGVASQAKRSDSTGGCGLSSFGLPESKGSARLHLTRSGRALISVRTPRCCLPARPSTAEGPAGDAAGVRAAGALECRRPRCPQRERCTYSRDHGLPFRSNDDELNPKGRSPVGNGRDVTDWCDVSIRLHIASERCCPALKGGAAKDHRCGCQHRTLTALAPRRRSSGIASGLSTE